MTDEEWLEFFKNYYGYEFNISLEQRTKKEIKYRTEMGLKIIDYNKQLKTVVKNRKTREEKIKVFIHKNYEILNSYLDYGFEIQNYIDNNYNGKCKRSNLIKNIGNGFKLKIMFHISDPCCLIDGIDIKLSFPKVVDGIGGILDNFNTSCKKQQNKIISDLLVMANRYVNTDILLIKSGDKNWYDER